MKNTIKALAAVAALALTACATDGNAPASNAPAAQTVNRCATADTMTADFGTIVHNVYLKPQFANDEAYASMLNDFNREAFVDSVFEAVYRHAIKITDMDGNPISLEDVKTREIEEPEFHRDKVAGIQFTEKWSFDPATHHMEKKVISMLIGYEVVDNGEIVAFRPGIMVHLK